MPGKPRGKWEEFGELDEEDDEERVIWSLSDMSSFLKASTVALQRKYIGSVTAYSVPTATSNNTDNSAKDTATSLTMILPTLVYTNTNILPTAYRVSFGFPFCFIFCP